MGIPIPAWQSLSLPIELNNLPFSTHESYQKHCYKPNNSICVEHIVLKTIIKQSKHTKYQLYDTILLCNNLSQWYIIQYSDVTMSVVASHITSVLIDCSNICSGVDQRKHQSFVSLAFVREIHRWPMDFPHKRTSDAKNVSIWWHHHVFILSTGIFQS